MYCCWHLPPSPHSPPLPDRCREVGGVLFRCTECPLCFCYEHNPPESEILHEGCPAMAALNYQPSSVVWIKCASCVQHSLTGERRLDIDVWCALCPRAGPLACECGGAEVVKTGPCRISQVVVLPGPVVLRLWLSGPVLLELVLRTPPPPGPNWSGTGAVPTKYPSRSIFWKT